MLKFKKMIFDNPYKINSYAVFVDTEKVVNNNGIINSNGKIVLTAQYEHIYDSLKDWAIVTKRYNVYNIKNDVYYGIIDSNFNEIISPDTFEYEGYDGYLEMEKKIYSLCENKYGISNEKNEMIKILKKI